MTRNANRIPIFIICLFISVCPSLAAAAEDESPEPINIYFGTKDFIEYYTAFNLRQAGKNYYRPDTVFSYQHALGKEGDMPIMMWNPPWLLTLMSPFLRYSFKTSSALWMMANVFLLFGSICIFQRAFNLPWKIMPRTIFLGLWMTPAIEAMAWGQSSMILCLAAALMVYGALRKSAWPLGIGMFLGTVKPHLFHLFYFLIVLDCFVRRPRYVLTAIGIGSGLLLIFSLVLIDRQELIWWAASLHHMPVIDGVQIVNTRGWITPTLSGMLRLYVRDSQVFLWSPMLFAWAVALFWYLARDRSWNEHAPIIIALSHFMSPFGWFFDMVIGLGLQISILKAPTLQKAGTLEFFIAISPYLLLHIAVVALSATFIDAQHEYVWFMPALLLATMSSVRIVKRWQHSNS